MDVGDGWRQQEKGEGGGSPTLYKQTFLPKAPLSRLNLFLNLGLVWNWAPLYLGIVSAGRGNRQ